MRQAWRYASTSNLPVFSSKNFRRFREARLQAVSSRKTNSLHGFEA